MSFRETRNLVEKMRLLGYPQSIPLDAFAMPNFTLVSQLLSWLLNKYDPGNSVSLDVSTEQDRLVFMKQAVASLASKANVKLNSKRLYMADGHAVRELLKCVQNLYDASLSAHSASTDADIPLAMNAGDVDWGMAKNSRQLASELTLQGASLFDRLLREEERNRVIAHDVDMSAVQDSLGHQMATLQTQMQQIDDNTSALMADEQHLVGKIAKKRLDLDRLNKRMESLQGVRPAWMDEYERLEKVMQALYSDYVILARNLAYLSHQMDQSDAHHPVLGHPVVKEQQQQQQQVKSMKEYAGSYVTVNGSAEGSIQSVGEQRRMNGQSSDDDFDLKGSISGGESDNLMDQDDDDMDNDDDMPDGADEDDGMDDLNDF